MKPFAGDPIIGGILQDLDRTKAERDSFQSQLREAQAQVVALRATLEACFELDGYPSHDDGCPEDDTCRCKVTAMVNDAFRDTSATAQETVERIEREALEAAADRAEKRLRDKGCTEDTSRLRSAILGEQP